MIWKALDKGKNEALSFSLFLQYIWFVRLTHTAPPERGDSHTGIYLSTLIQQKTLRCTNLDLIRTEEDEQDVLSLKATCNQVKLQNSQQLGTNPVCSNPADGITEVTPETTPSKTTYKLKDQRETSWITNVIASQILTHWLIPLSGTTRDILAASPIELTTKAWQYAINYCYMKTVTSLTA